MTVAALNKQQAVMVESPRYDRATLVHWLVWDNRCLRASGEEFQHLFEEVMERHKPSFVRIRPYGKFGDRKCDGMIPDAGIFFQVYSPDDLKQAELQTKIENDLAGAMEYWKDQLQEWVFVYNVRRGLPPDIPAILSEQQKKYPHIRLNHLSNTELWEIARSLGIQQRSEILGPLGDHDEPPQNAGTTISGVANRRERILIVQDINAPIDITAAAAAMQPDIPLGPPIMINPQVTDEDTSWPDAGIYQAERIKNLLTKSRDLKPRFAAFSLAPIPLAIQLGFLFSDRVDVRLFQYDRGRRSWAWDEVRGVAADTEFTMTGVPTSTHLKIASVIIRVSLSAMIAPEHTLAVAGYTPIQIDITTSKPSIMWLRNAEQLTRLGEIFRTAMQAIDEHLPACQRIHLFGAVPTPAAIILGQAISPRMNPPVALYEYARNKKPRYRKVLTLE